MRVKLNNWKHLLFMTFLKSPDSLTHPIVRIQLYEFNLTLSKTIFLSVFTMIIKFTMMYFSFTFVSGNSGAMSQLVCLLRSINCLTVWIATSIRPNLKNCFAHLVTVLIRVTGTRQALGLNSWIFLKDGKPAFNKPPPSQNGWLVSIVAVRRVENVERGRFQVPWDPKPQSGSPWEHIWCYSFSLWFKQYPNCLTVWIATSMRPNLKNCFDHLVMVLIWVTGTRQALRLNSWIFLKDGKPAFNKPPPSQNGWLVSIAAVWRVWRMLKEAGFKYSYSCI